MTPLQELSLLSYCASSFPKILQANLSCVQMLCVGHVKLQLLLLRDVVAAGLLKSSHLSSKTSPWLGGLTGEQIRSCCVLGLCHRVPAVQLCFALWSIWIDDLSVSGHSYISQDCVSLRVVHGKPEGSLTNGSRKHSSAANR